METLEFGLKSNEFELVDIYGKNYYVINMEIEYIEVVL